ncbi:Helicase protein MOM1 [Glycine max]|nr:Helicase protein MOM1 [Glycine max]
MRKYSPIVVLARFELPWRIPCDLNQNKEKAKNTVAKYVECKSHAQCSAKQMVNGTRSSHNAKDEENNNRRVTQDSEKGKIKSHPNVSDTTGVRRSPRETSSKKNIPNPSSSTRKSGRLENRAPPAPVDKRKSGRIEKKMPSPLRRSGRTRSQSSAGYSDSKSSGSVSSDPKPKKEKSVKQLIFEAKEVNGTEEHHLGTPRIRVKRMTARMYRSLFQLPKEEPNRTDKLNQGGNNGEGQTDECSKESHDCEEISKNGVLSSEDGKSKEMRVDIGSSGSVKDLVEITMAQGSLAPSNVALPSEDGKSKEMRVDTGLSGPVKDLVENTMTLDSLAPSNAATYETGLASESFHPDYCREETLQVLVSSNSILDEDSIRNGVGDHRGENLIPSKSKEITVDMNSDVSSMLAKGDNCNLTPDASSLSRLGGNLMGTDRPSNATLYETGLLPERVQPDCCREETLPSSYSENGVLPSEDGKSKEARVDSGLSVPVKDLVDNTVTLGSLAPSTAATYEIGLAPESIQADYLREKGNSILDEEDLIRISVGHDSSGETLLPSKRKGIMVGMDSGVSAMLAKGDYCNLVPDSGSPSQLGGNIMGTNGSCSKQIRLDYNPTVRESCIPSATELQDGHYIDASMLQKDSQIDNEKESGLITNSNSSATQLKERLSSHIGYRCKSDSFSFVEYWVPVQISNLQLEQYCSILLSNASILRSSSKVDSVEAVRDVLISTRKCCSHPYLVGPELQPSLNKGLEPIEYLDFDLKASGKLQLLDSMLEELRKNDLRVLILFQSIGGSGRVIGNYLEDLLRPKFGSDSYERIDKSLPPSKKHAAMKKFNDKNNRRFVFLLETCACLPSIKLSSVDSIIIFDSDWNPMNDIRSLQKLTLDSQFELIKIFRLYSSFTVEEKALILSKQCKIFDINSPNWTIFHMLLMWGASCLFDELKVFHDGETSSSNVKSLFGQPLLKEAMHEFSSLLSQDGEHIDSSNCSTLLKVQQNGATYHANSSLLGELKFRVLGEEPTQIFWTKLLEGKQFQWKYLNSSSQRSRKKVYHFDGSVNGPDLVNEGASKKRRKISNNIVEQPSSKSEDEKLSNGIKADRSQGNNAESEPKSRQHDEQRSLLLLLKPEIRKLCDVLLLPDNVKRMIDNFLEYVMNNHDVNREPFSISQAFQLSLCWTAASLLKHKLDPIASLIQDLNFECKKEEVDYICSMLCCLKKIFLYRTGNYHDTGSPKASGPSNRAYSCTGVAREVELFKKDMSKSIEEIQKKCEKKLKKLHILQEEEKQRLRAAIEEEKAKFEERYKIESAVIRSCSPNDVTRMEKLRVLNTEYEKGIEELKFHHDSCLKDLEDKQLAEIQKFQDKEAAWVEDVKSWADNEYLSIIASKELGTGVESLQTCDQVLPDSGLKNHLAGTAANPPSSMEQKSDGGAVNELSDRELRLSNGPDNNTLLSPQNQNSGGPLDVQGLDRVLSPRACQAASSSDGPNAISIPNPLLEQQTTNGVPLSIPAAVDCHDDIEHLTNAVLGDKRTTSDQQEGAPKTMTELSQGTPVSRTVNVTDPPEQVQQVSSAELPSSHLDSTNLPFTTELEHQPTVVPNQDVQPDSNLKVDSHSHSHEVFVHPASNSDPNTVTPSEVRVQSADTTNLSTPLEINYQNMQAETHSSSRMVHLSYDPLNNELDRIQKVTEQAVKNYEDKKSQLKTDFEKELEELRRKYDVKFQGIEVEFKQRKTTLDTNRNLLLGLNARLLNHLVHQECCQHMVTPIRAGYSASGFSHNVSARSPIIDTISLPVGNPQAGVGQIRAPAPHLQPYRQ